MKRYWKIISICLITILVIGTFYIQSSFATSNHGKVDFEKVSGDENELQNIMLFGNFLPDGSNLYQYLQITSEETFDSTNLSFSQKISRLGVPSYLEDLVEKYKNFMRSKDLTPNHFFEDDNVVAYAHIKNPYERPIDDFSFEIEVLTKQSAETTSFKLEVPEKEHYGWMHVEDVQVIDDELKVVTQGFRLEGRQHEVRVYTFDRSKLKLISNDMIASTQEVENGYSDLRIIHDTYSIQQQKYLLVKSETFENEGRNSNGKPNLVEGELIIYNIENNQSKKVIASDEIFESIGGSSAIYNSTLFILQLTENGSKVIQYDIENDKWGEKLSFDLSDTKDNERGSHTQIVNGKLYTIRDTVHGHTIVIGDLETGESLYEGKLKVTNQGVEQKDYRLYIHEIEFVQ